MLDDDVHYMPRVDGRRICTAWAVFVYEVLSSLCDLIDMSPLIEGFHVSGRLELLISGLSCAWPGWIDRPFSFVLAARQKLGIFSSDHIVQPKYPPSSAVLENTSEFDRRATS